MSRVSKRATNAYQSSVHGKMKWVMLSGGRQGWKMAYQDSNNKTGLAATSMRPGSMPRSLWCKRTTCGPLKKEEGRELADPCLTCEAVTDIDVNATSASEHHYNAIIEFELPACISNILGTVAPGTGHAGIWVYIYEGSSNVPYAKEQATNTSQDFFRFHTSNGKFAKGQWYNVVIETYCRIDGMEQASRGGPFYFNF